MFDWHQLANPTALAALAIAYVAGHYLRPKLKAVLVALPHMAAVRAKARFDAAVAKGEIPPAIARLVVKLKRATFEWADEELPNDIGAEKMAGIIAALERLPYIGVLVKADPKGIEDDLQAEFDALHAEVHAQRGGGEEQPAAPPPSTPTP